VEEKVVVYLRYCTEISLEILRKTTANSHDSNQGSPDTREKGSALGN
jgi:hypothetical protein